MAHTPGPWYYTSGNLIRVIQRGTGVCIAGAHRIGKARDCAEAERVSIDNARLIAATPDLVTACQAVVASGMRNAAYDACVAALQKALGQ